MYRDELAKFLIKSRKLITKDAAILRVKLPMLPGGWGEDFVPVSKFPKSFCVMVSVPDAPEMIKPFTPIDWGTDYMDLLVKTYPQGKISKLLFEAQPGQTILMQGPRQKFDLLELFEKKQPKRILALAAGTGITPIYQIIKYFESREIPSPRFLLVYANKSKEDILLKQELESIKLRNFEIRHVIEAERRSESENGYIKLNDIETSSADGSDHVLVCGPRGFNELLLGTDEYIGGGYLKDKLYGKEQIFKF